jgi:signal transduction histidine kinase
MTFQKLVLGNQPIETETQKRKILLGAYLIFMYLGIDVFFFVVNLFNTEGTPTTLLVGTLISFICLVLIKRGWIDTAIVLHLIRSNVLAFIFAYHETDVYRTGTYLYFIPACLGALAVFGYQERWKGIGFTVISFILFLIAILDVDKLSPQDAHFYFIINFLIVLIIGLLILLFFDRMVIESEKRVLQKNDELEKANSELDRFVYSVSHDLRAPLSSILGLVQIYRFAGGDKERTQIIDHIQVRALKLDEFIREILDYARNTRTEIKQVSVDLKQIVEDAMENLRFVEGSDRIKMSVEAPPVSEIRTDPERLKVIFNNILSNSIKYQDFTKLDSFVKIIIEQEANGWMIQVQDNGIGIRTEYQSRIFGMFYRANDDREGSGLGLYIVKETVERLGGKIEMKSTYTEGTVFDIFLPTTG